MIDAPPKLARARLLRVALSLAVVGMGCLPTPAQEMVAACSLDLTNAGHMKDIVSNALMLGVLRESDDVDAFLENAETRFATGDALLSAAAEHFGLTDADLEAEVERFRHVNCGHEGGGRHSDESEPDETLTLSDFARDVTLHVVLHELGHALVREFDLPILGNEETLADSFATHFLTYHLPERAVAVLEARVTSLMSEARDVDREVWTVTGEHNSDARRAYQIAALAVAADPERYASVADLVDMSARDRRASRDYGSEIHRSWRRTLAPLWMPGDVTSTESRVVCESDDPLLAQLCADSLVDEIRAALSRFDWHSQVTVRFVGGDGGAGWSRSKRTVTVHGEYVRRFVEQGRAETSRATPPQPAATPR